MLPQVTTLLPFHITNPFWLLGIPLALILLIFLVTRTFVTLPLTREQRRHQRRMRIFLVITRLLIITCLLIVLAQPYTEETREVQGDARVTILVDQSKSMQFMDTSFREALASAVSAGVATTVREFGTDLTSDVGSAILQNLEPGGTILLLSDGYPTSGAALQDVAFYATTINATISAINLTPLAQEWSVRVAGPGKVLSESDTNYRVIVEGTDDAPVPLTVTIDGTTVFQERVTPGTYPFTTKFTTGAHELEARITTQDGYADNDVYWKSVTAIEKPTILLVTTKTSPLELLLKELYTVEKRSRLPENLDPYYAIVANDVPVENLASTTLDEYLIDEAGDYYGGGLVLFAGLNSFDKGGYSGSALEQFLPVKVGQGERRKGTTNLVFVVDVSGGVGGTKYVADRGVLAEVTEAVPTIDVIKAQVYKAVEQLRIENRVGIIIFGVPPDTGGTLSENIASSVRVLTPLDYLYNNRKELLNAIPRITGGGPSALDIALKAAAEMLKNQQGDKVIVLLTDGRYCAGLGAECPEGKQVKTLVSNMKRIYGINFMTIGVGTADENQFPKKVDEVFLKSLAKTGDGTYDRATRLNTLLIKYGDPKAKAYGDEFQLVPLSLTHFITEDVEPTATLNAYAQVVPKDTAELLITTDSGQPALTVWRYGNGRVATWTVYAGGNLGQLLNEDNSILISRTINWAIGDPQRKQSSFVDIPDVRSNEHGVITIRSDTPITSEVLDFTKEGNTYTASFTPGPLGFNKLFGATYAVNRPREYDHIGMNPLLASTVASTGGKLFKPTESDAIIEHVREVSKRVMVEREDVALPFIAAALFLFLVEIFIRRLTERRRQ
ncbi:VWA domain-containing protein [Candidatus Woesearchaeota archaeon]|nr:MAG: VWA domain-containing protein [Candidatus Woesearchaeota archaeon]